MKRSKTTIRVTQEHINRGKRGSITGCPIAHALRGVTGYPQLAVRWGVVIFIDYYGEPDYERPLIDLIVELPRPVWTKILDYDLGHDMKPFEFEL